MRQLGVRLIINMINTSEMSGKKIPKKVQVSKKVKYCSNVETGWLITVYSFFGDFSRSGGPASSITFF